MNQGGRRNTATKVWLFLAGLGSYTEVHFFGSIAISELFFYALAPLLFFKNYAALRRDGFLPWVWLTILVCVGCFISSKVNGTYWLFMLKGIAVPAVYFSATIVFHHLLRKDPSAVKWFLIGLFLSSIISIFIFQRETFTVQGGEMQTGEDAVDAVVGNPLFWAGKINAVLKLPINCFYLSVPLPYSVAAPIVGAIITVLTSGNTGRAAAAVSVAASACIFFGGKSRFKQAWVGRHIILFLVAGVFVAFAVKTVYSHAASSGLMGESAKTKYERQTEMGSGLLDILMAGRMELFCGLRACIDRPIIGFGPRTEDRYGYAERFYKKYGTHEDVQNYFRTVQLYLSRTGGFPPIPDHSHLVYFWLRYGVFGLTLWMFVFWQMFMYFRRYSSAVPQWYGYMCLTIPSMCWSILFNPPGGRTSTTFFVVCLLMCRAIYKRRIMLPFEMEMEAQHAR